MRISLRNIAAVAALVMFPLAASAHLAGGEDVTKDGYILDFGYDPSPPVAGTPVTFALNLADAKTERAVAPDSVWVRVIKDDKAVFAGTFKPQNGSVAFTTVLPDAGPYAVTARYAYRGKTLEGTYALTAAASIPAETVAPAPPTEKKETTDGRDAGRLLAAVIVALGAYFYGASRGSRSKTAASDKTH